MSAGSNTTRKNAATVSTAVKQGNGDILVNGSITVTVPTYFANGHVVTHKPLAVESPGAVDSFGRIRRHA